MIRFALLLTVVAAAPVFADKVKVLLPAPVVPQPEPVVISTGRYDLAKLMKEKPQFDTAEKVARALSDHLRLAYDARKKGDRRVVVVSGKVLEVRAFESDHRLIRLFLDQGGKLTPQDLR